MFRFGCSAARRTGDAHFDATRSRTYKSGDYRITETDHYDAYRAGSLAFEKIPVDGSEKMPDEHMDSIEPYDYSELKPFSTAYLPGFLADKFDVTAEGQPPARRFALCRYAEKRAGKDCVGL